MYFISAQFLAISLSISFFNKPFRFAAINRCSNQISAFCRQTPLGFLTFYRKMIRPSPEEYLAPDFDPSKLTVSMLTSILASHDVELPVSKHRKEYYVELFQIALKPKADQILKQISSVVPSDEGIVKVSEKFDFGLDSDSEVVVSGFTSDISDEVATDDETAEIGSYFLISQ